jgi:hypothetical protein
VVAHHGWDHGGNGSGGGDAADGPARPLARPLLLVGGFGVTAFLAAFCIALLLGRGIAGSVLAALLVPVALSGALAVGLAAAFVVAVAAEQPDARLMLRKVFAFLAPAVAVVALFAYAADPGAPVRSAAPAPSPSAVPVPVRVPPRRTPPVPVTPPRPAGPGAPGHPTTVALPAPRPVIGPVVPPVAGPVAGPVARPVAAPAAGPDRGPRVRTPLTGSRTPWVSERDTDWWVSPARESRSHPRSAPGCRGRHRALGRSHRAPRPRLYKAPSAHSSGRVHGGRAASRPC